MGKSILQDVKRCYFCGNTANLEKHHIYFAALRNTSERNGFVVWLCCKCHRDNKYGVHGNREMDLQLKRECQAKYEESHSRTEWLDLIGRNYLED